MQTNAHIRVGCRKACNLKNRCSVTISAESSIYTSILLLLLLNFSFYSIFILITVSICVSSPVIISVDKNLSVCLKRNI